MTPVESVWVHFAFFSTFTFISSLESNVIGCGISALSPIALPQLFQELEEGALLERQGS